MCLIQKFRNLHHINARHYATLRIRALSYFMLIQLLAEWMNERNILITCCNQHVIKMFYSFKKISHTEVEQVSAEWSLYAGVGWLVAYTQHVPECSGDRPERVGRLCD